jgi:hypothetical protein
MAPEPCRILRMTLGFLSKRERMDDALAATARAVTVFVPIEMQPSTRNWPATLP